MLLCSSYSAILITIIDLEIKRERERKENGVSWPCLRQDLCTFYTRETRIIDRVSGSSFPVEESTEKSMRAEGAFKEYYIFSTRLLG